MVVTMEVRKMQRRGDHVMFSVSVKGIKTRRFRETYKKVRGKLEITRTISNDADDDVDFSGIELDGYWNGSEVVITELTPWRDREWLPTPAQKKQAIEVVKNSDHMVRVVKTLQKVK